MRREKREGRREKGEGRRIFSLPVLSSQLLEKRNGRLVVARRPSRAWTTQGRGIAAAVLLLPAADG
jgi:hypothetical protein